MTGLSILLAVSLSAGNAEFERNANDLAADIALGRLAEETWEKGLSAGVLERKMLANPAAFRNRGEAEKLCREIYAVELEKQYEAAAKAIEERLGVTGEGTAVLSKPPYQEMMEKLFPKAFQTERAAACAAQAKNIALKVKPDETELEAQDDRTVREGLVRRVAEVSGLVVFDENMSYISEKIVDPLLADARKEQKRQQEYLMRTRCDSYAPSVLKCELEENLKKNVAERQAKCEDPVRAWGVFPKTLASALPTAVERRLGGLVVKRANEVPLAVDEEAVRKEIASAPERHRSAKASEQIFLDQYTRAVMAGAVEKAIQDAPVREREEFAAFVRARADSAELKKETEGRLRREILPKWRKVRGEIVKKESSRLWPTLMDGTWYPSADVADRIVARSDSAVVLRNWRDSDDFEYLKAKASLEESDAAADQSIVKAFELARKAIAAEKEIVDEVHPSVLQDAKDRKNSFFTRTPDLAKVTEMLTDAVEEKWNERRVDILWKKDEAPANAEDQHAEIFPSVRRYIELIARQILDEMEKEEADEQNAESSSESSGNSDEENDLCTIEFEISGGEVTVRAKRGGSVIAERRAKARAKDFENAVREVGAVVGQKVLYLK